jgi:glycine dehydrogenase
MTSANSLDYTDRFVRRHIGPSEAEIGRMLDFLGYGSLDDLIGAAIPEAIRLRRALELPAAATEHEALAELREIARQNRVFRSFLGMGYHDTITPPVVLRNILENPGWYTAYTPYQAEIAQGRLEALLNFQTMVIDLTGLPIANASLLDEATAAAEAMALSHAVKGGRQGERNVYLVSDLCHPQVIDVVRTRARARGWEVAVGDHRGFEFGPQVFGALIQYPATDGAVHDSRELVERAHAADALVTVACDLLSLTLLTPPGEWGADVAVGNTQRFGVPLGYGGPHAAFFATRDEYKRQLPGGSSACPRTRRAIPRCAWRCRRASSTSGARRRRATSARRRCCWPSWRACTRSTTGRTGSARSPRGCTAWLSCWGRGCGGSATRWRTRRSSTPCASMWASCARPRSSPRPRRARSTCAGSAAAWSSR